MWEEIFNVALSNGIFATLFVFLFIYQLKDSSKREKKYQETIESLNEHLNIIIDVKQEVDEIKKIIILKKEK